MQIKAVLFDIDGTLIDSNDAHVAVWDEVFRRNGFKFDSDLIHSQIGKGGDLLVPFLIPDADEDMTKTFSELHGEIFEKEYLEKMQPFPRARDLLMRVRDAGQKVVFASSANQSDLDHYLETLEAHDLVTATTSIDDVETSKPAPDIFSVALQKVAPLLADEVIVVGDTPYDVEAAAKCGIRTVGLRSGKFSDDLLLKAGAVAIYDDAAALLADYDNSPLAK